MAALTRSRVADADLATRIEASLAIGPDSALSPRRFDGVVGCRDRVMTTPD